MLQLSHHRCKLGAAFEAVYQVLPVPQAVVHVPVPIVLCQLMDWGCMAPKRSGLRLVAVKSKASHCL